ncbi:MAG: glycoside hydrolase family 3 protein [Treponema sp.]|jgi:beta-N-acetylhexosaminidase|nr:glycoside hydrolase family 3 protein [Treponema sp.]
MCPFLVWTLGILVFMGCTRDSNRMAPSQQFPQQADTAAPQPEPVKETQVYREQAARLAASLDDPLLAAQVLMTGIDGKTPALSDAMKTLLRNSPPGGIMLFKYNLDTEKETIRAFLDACSGYSRVALSEPDGPLCILPFIAVDHEGGAVQRFGPEVTQLPEPAWFWETAQKHGRDYALQELETTARRSGEEIRALGITMNLAPVAEVLDEENRLFLEARSYGPDPDFTEAAVHAFIRGMEAAGIACVVKHFPGNTRTDPHKGRAILAADAETLDRMVQPFVGVIRDKQPPAIMVSHIVVPGWDRERNASLSPKIIREWLRGKLGFTGIVIGDDFSMGAVADSGLSLEAAVVEALNAGVDMVMTWPRNLRGVHQAILKAVQEGRLPRERLQEAVEQILFEKLRYGLIQGEQKDAL